MTAYGAVTILEYPVDAYGDLVPLPAKREVARWVKNEPFKATMRYQGHIRASGSNSFLWRSHDGREWTMSMTDMDWLLRHADLVDAATTGVWRIRKRGYSYGLEWLGAASE